jgi:hypothetical protein
MQQESRPIGRSDVLLSLRRSVSEPQITPVACDFASAVLGLQGAGRHNGTSRLNEACTSSRARNKNVLGGLVQGCPGETPHSRHMRRILQSAGDHILSNTGQALELMNIADNALCAHSRADEHKVYEAAFDIDKEDFDQQAERAVPPPTRAPAILPGPNQWDDDLNQALAETLQVNEEHQGVHTFSLIPSSVTCGKLCCDLDADPLPAITTTLQEQRPNTSEVEGAPTPPFKNLQTCLVALDDGNDTRLTQSLSSHGRMGATSREGLGFLLRVLCLMPEAHKLKDTTNKQVHHLVHVPRYMSRVLMESLSSKPSLRSIDG